MRVRALTKVKPLSLVQSRYPLPFLSHRSGMMTKLPLMMFSHASIKQPCASKVRLMLSEKTLDEIVTKLDLDLNGKKYFEQLLPYEKDFFKKYLGKLKLDIDRKKTTVAISIEQLDACKVLSEFEALPESLMKKIIELPLEAITYDNPRNRETTNKQKLCCQILAGFGSASSGVVRNMCIVGLLNYTEDSFIGEISKEAIKKITCTMTPDECEEFKLYLKSKDFQNTPSAKR